MTQPVEYLRIRFQKSEKLFSDSTFELTVQALGLDRCARWQDS